MKFPRSLPAPPIALCCLLALDFEVPGASFPKADVTTAGFADASNGDYAYVFDTPLTASLNITATKFRIVVTPSNPSGTGSFNVEIGTLACHRFSGARLSVSGTVSGALPAASHRMNLPHYQPTTTSSANGQYIADYATDGVVANTANLLPT